MMPHLVAPQWPLWGEKDFAQLQSALAGGGWSRGRAIAEFEEAFASFCGCRHALLVNSGTQALGIALRAAGVDPGDEVIVPGLTWPATAVAALECGATVVVVDVEEDTYGISLTDIERHITSRTKAVVAVHLYNSSADVEALNELATQHGVILIEDAAQVHGCQWRSKQLGTFGRAGSFSFQEKKLLPCGEGGCIITDNDALFAQAFALRDFGARWGAGARERCGASARVATMAAAVLNSQLERLPDVLRIEEEVGRYLTDLLDEVQGVRCLRRREEITRQTYYSFCFRLVSDELRRDARAIIEDLRDTTGISFEPAYRPLSDSSFFNPDAEARYYGKVRFGALRNCSAAAHYSIRFPHPYLLQRDDKWKFACEWLRDTIVARTRR